MHHTQCLENTDAAQVKQQEKKTATCVTTWHQHNVLNITTFCFYIQFQMLKPHLNKYLCKQSECWKVCLVLSEHRSADVHMKQTDNKKDRPMDLLVKLFTVHLWINLSVLNASCMWVLYHVKHTCKHSQHITLQQVWQVSELIVIHFGYRLCILMS